MQKLVCRCTVRPFATLGKTAGVLLAVLLTGHLAAAQEPLATESGAAARPQIEVDPAPAEHAAPEDRTAVEEAPAAGGPAREAGPPDVLAPTPLPAGLDSSGEEFFPGSEKPRRGTIGVGMGFNYFDFAQISDVYSDIAYKSLLGPSFSADGRLFFNSDNGIEASYAKHPGAIKGGAGINVDSEYAWRHVTLEWLHRLKSWPVFFRGQTRSETSLRFGAQYHVLPYYEVGPSSLTLRDRSVGMASLGLEHLLEFAKFRFQIFMRYQYPVFKEGIRGQSPTVQQKFAFDGSIGAQYRLSNAWNFGIFWYGQWHEFTFPVDIGSGSQDVHQKLFFSNAELNLSYDF